MNQITVAKYLREKYCISARQLAGAAGVSQQYISDLELGKYSERYDYVKTGTPLIYEAFENVIRQRKEQLRQLSVELAKYRCRLLNSMEETDEL